MTKLLSFFSSLVLLLLLSATGCQSPVEGCTDPNANNFDPEANQDNGTCDYGNPPVESGIVFWFSQATANSYSNDGVTSFKYYVDGELEGTQAVSLVNVTAPPCNDPNRVTVYRDVPVGDFEYYPFVLANQDDDTIATGFFQFFGGQCYGLELTY